MLIYLMRHGIATPRGEVGIDEASRALTAEGAEKVRRISAALHRLKTEFDEIWTSSLVRARQTADIVAETWALTERIRNIRELEPGGDLGELIDQLRNATGLRGVLLAGHEPDMGELAGMLISGRQDAAIRFKKGGWRASRWTSSPRIAWGSCNGF